MYNFRFSACNVFHSCRIQSELNKCNGLQTYNFRLNSERQPYRCVRSEVIEAVSTNIWVFWNVTSYSTEDGYKHFGVTCCLYLQNRRHIH
jgi:hypothetical protein